VLSVERLTKDYGPLRALDDVSFRVERGEVAALLGPNGSGKSTLMRVLTGYFAATAGHVRVDGHAVGEQPAAARRRVGYLPEQVSLYPELTVRRTLEFVAAVKGLVGRARRVAVEEAIARCGLAEVADRLAGKLSKGYRQRVGLAQALVGDPPLLVLDEPTVGLDPVQTREMRALLVGLTGQRTVLLSTHVLSEASALCTRVVILANGRLIADETPAALSRRVAGLGRLLVRVEGPPTDVAAALRALPGVLAVEQEPGDGPGAVFVVRCHEPDPVRRRVAGTVVGGGWILLELRTEAVGLEDLFVRLLEPRGT
jgi:ABC-2 type transport system ATP-binding protein